MQKEELIPAAEFCASHNIEISFVRTLQQSGLIEMATVQETGFIPAEQLQQLEKIVRMHYEMDINLEGIETITHLLQRIGRQQQEILQLKNKLRIYESND
jgi:hypothetical protein